MEDRFLSYSDAWLSIYAGDCREVLATLPAESVDTVVTSPPYWGLRDYGTASWIGGATDCSHLPPSMRKRGEGKRSTLHGGYQVIYEQELAQAATRSGGTCQLCGALRVDRQIGLEATPDEYVETLVAVCRELWRILRPEGTLWLNLGDTYANGNAFGYTGRNDNGRPIVDQERGWKQYDIARTPVDRSSGLKPKDLVGIPWRVAFALQADGWYLRQDIIWSKPNVMPESVTDRPTRSHEYVFLLAKQERYYFDAEAVREPAAASSLTRYAYSFEGSGYHAGNSDPHGGGFRGRGLSKIRNGEAPDGRNIRSVWTIQTKSYSGSHFAVFPPKLVEPCVKAGAPEGGVVLDPFAGSGTVGLVAQKLSRRAVLVDLNPDYLRQQLIRNANLPLGLTEAI